MPVVVASPSMLPTLPRRKKSAEHESVFNGEQEACAEIIAHITNRAESITGR
jgi:hypothetical protein